MVSLLQISFPLFVAPKIHLMTSFPEVQQWKVDEDEDFYYKIYYISSRCPLTDTTFLLHYLG